MRCIGNRGKQRKAEMGYIYKRGERFVIVRIRSEGTAVDACRSRGEEGEVRFESEDDRVGATISMSVLLKL